MNRTTLIADLIPSVLFDTVTRHLDVPQIGIYHTEGPTLASHIDLMLDVLSKLVHGEIVGELPEDIAAFLIEKVSAFNRFDLIRFVLLHDLGKAEKMQMVVGDETTEITLEDWEALTAEQQAAVEKISYIGHDKASGQILSEAGFPNELVAKAVTFHMRAVSGFDTKVNVALFEKVYADWSDREIAFQVLTRYLDQAGSLREDGNPDLTGVTWLYRSWQAAVAYKELSERLDTTDRLDGQKVQKAKSAARKAGDAFLGETVDEAYERIVADCSLPEVTEAQVREALADAIEQGLSGELVEAIVADMTTTGKLGREVGKQLRQFNRIVRPALARLG